MLRLQVVRSSGVPYYVDELVPGRAEGTGVAGESPGVWTGRGSAVLGVRGVVGAAEFAELCAGRDPLGDRPLRGDGPRGVAAVDLLFCAPKSVSLLHLLAPRELSTAAGDAHDAAVAAAVGHLERTGLGVRRTRGGVTHHLGATGVVAAGFTHRTSRALDPHLHTHLVAANVAQGVDGVWSAVDTRRLFLHRRPLEAAYDAALRRQLTDRLGVAWERGAAGRWDVVGVDPVLARLFSQRAASIDERRSRGAGGRRSPGGRRADYHADRPAKEAGPTVDGLRAGWRRRAADLGLDPADLVQVVGRARARGDRDGVDGEALSAGLGRLAARRPTLDRRELLVAVAAASPSGLGAVELEAVVDGLTRAADSGPAGGAADRSRLDPPSTGGPGGRRWPTADLVRVLDDGTLPLDTQPGPTGHDRCAPERGRGRASVLGRVEVAVDRSPGWDHGPGPTGPGHRW